MEFMSRIIFFFKLYYMLEQFVKYITYIVQSVRDFFI